MNSFENLLSATLEEIRRHGAKHDVWQVSLSGGKDSTVVLQVIAWAIASGEVNPPQKLLVVSSDTRLELPALMSHVGALMENAQRLLRGIVPVECKIVMAPIEKRILPNILGRGVSIPTNNTNRWCTRQAKIDPMREHLRGLRAEYDSVLQFVGVREGESASRDKNIKNSCAVGGSECGQSRYQALEDDKEMKGFLFSCDPILKWRVADVWLWLWGAHNFGGWDNDELDLLYSMQDYDARTGCMGCPLVNHDHSLEAISKHPKFAHLAPMVQLNTLLISMRGSSGRLRKTEEIYKTGKKAGQKSNRMGPFTMVRRLTALYKVIELQELAGVNVLNDDEIKFIFENITEKSTFPRGWRGDEELADDTEFMSNSAHRKSGGFARDLFWKSRDELDAPFISESISALIGRLK